MAIGTVGLVVLLVLAVGLGWIAHGLHTDQTDLAGTSQWRHVACPHPRPRGLVFEAPHEPGHSKSNVAWHEMGLDRSLALPFPLCSLRCLLFNCRDTAERAERPSRRTARTGCSRCAPARKRSRAFT